MTAFALPLVQIGSIGGDSYIDSAAPTTNFGSDTLVKVGKINNFGTRHQRAILGRNVSGDFPAGAIIDTCGISKEVVSVSAGAGATEASWLKLINPGNWLEAGVTYNNRNSILAWSTPGGDMELVSPAPVPWNIPAANGPDTSWGLELILTDSLTNEGGSFAVIGKKDVETGSPRWFHFLSSLDQNNPVQLVGTYHVPITIGYRLYLKAGVLPNPAVDQPVATVDSTALNAVLDMNALGLAANTDYFGIVSPFNSVGRAVSSAPFCFRTDGSGFPIIIPTPVSQLTAIPLAGGDVRVAWTYDERNPIAVADTFEIEVFNDTSSFPFSVPHVAPGRTYTRNLTIGTDGLFQVRVKSAKAGLSQANVSTVAVRLDATPPAVVPVTLSAV